MHTNNTLLNSRLLSSTLRHTRNTLNKIFPRKCMICDTPCAQPSNCCTMCFPQLPFQSNACRHCGQCFDANQDYCGRCISNPPPFDLCFCAFRYEQPISPRLQAFKYEGKPELVKSLAYLLYEEVVANEIPIPELLIPVPCHTSKLRQRGYNQSLLLVKELSKLLSIPFSNNHVEKHKPTKPQMKLSLEQRRKNVRGSFSLTQTASAKHIAIIDDVFTTGATTAEITKLLKKNGVDYIQVWAVAHTN